MRAHLPAHMGEERLVLSTYAKVQILPSRTKVGGTSETCRGIVGVLTEIPRF